MTDRVTELENELARLQVEVVRCKCRLQEAREEAAGIKVGDLVTARGVTYKVTRIEFHPWRKDGKPWLSGARRTKAGAWSKIDRYLYADWKKP